MIQKWLNPQAGSFWYILGYDLQYWLWILSCLFFLHSWKYLNKDTKGHLWFCRNHCTVVIKTEELHRREECLISGDQNLPCLLHLHLFRYPVEKEKYRHEWGSLWSHCSYSQTGGTCRACLHYFLSRGRRHSRGCVFFLPSLAFLSCLLNLVVILLQLLSVVILAQQSYIHRRSSYIPLCAFIVLWIERHSLKSRTLKYYYVS